MSASIFVRYVINKEIWLHYFLGHYVYYVSYIYFELLAAGDTTECILGMIFVNWCIVKLNCIVDFHIACIILSVVNDTGHMKRKMISCTWGVGYVTMILEFSDPV